jgi:hypothetical protein
VGEATLERLEKLRREEVDRARAAVFEALREKRARTAVHQEAVAACIQRDAGLRAARAQFASSSTVAGLRWSASVTAAAHAALADERARAARAERARAEAAALLQAREGALQRAELDRRVVARARARSERQHALSRERRREDEADDLARARLSR